MALNPAQRMARLRARQKEAGLVSLSIVVPAGDAAAFVRLAERRRTTHLNRRAAPEASVRPPHVPGKVRTTRISPADILAFREMLEVAAVSLVARRMNGDHARRLKAHLQREQALNGDASSTDLQRMHLLLGELSGDAALELLLRIAMQLTDERSPFSAASPDERERLVTRIKRLNAGIVEALVDRNESLAVRRMRRYLSGLREWLE